MAKNCSCKLDQCTKVSITILLRTRPLFFCLVELFTLYKNAFLFLRVVFLRKTRIWIWNQFCHIRYDIHKSYFACGPITQQAINFYYTQRFSFFLQTINVRKIIFFPWPQKNKISGPVQLLLKLSMAKVYTRPQLHSLRTLLEFCFALSDSKSYNSYIYYISVAFNCNM